jgi:hypothetical protein
VHAGTGPAAIAEADEDTAKPKGRRRSRSKRNVAEGEREERAASPAGETDIREPESAGLAAEAEGASPSEDGDDAVSSKPRRRGRRGGRRRSRANAAEVPEASE